MRPAFAPGSIRVGCPIPWRATAAKWAVSGRQAADPGGATEAKPFGLPFTEAIDSFLSRHPLTDQERQTWTREAQRKAFWVSRVNNEALVEAMYNHLGRALERGTTYADFKAGVNQTAESLGVSPLNPFKLRTIFETQMGMAFAAGQYRQMTHPEVIKQRPYWRYVSMGDSRVRPAHAALHGKTLPADDPFWDTCYPPNGFRCRCRVVSLSADEAEADGIKVERSRGGVVQIQPLDPATGQRLPAQPFEPDPGFAFNPGQIEWGRPMAKTVADEYRAAQRSGYSRLNERDQAGPLPGLVPLAAALGRPLVTAAEHETALTKILGGGSRILDDPSGRPVLLAKDMGQHLAEDGGRGPYLPLLPHVITDPAEVWTQVQKSDLTGRIVLRRVYLQAYDVGGKSRGVVAVAEYRRGCWTGFTTYPERDLARINNWRWGFREWPKKA